MTQGSEGTLESERGSWLIVDSEDADVPPPPGDARDAGWASAMRALLAPLVAELTARGSKASELTLLEPFCGYGTTLLACAQLNIRGIGVEIERARADIANERLAKASARDQRVVVGDVRTVVGSDDCPRASCDFFATSVPYAPVRQTTPSVQASTALLASGNLYTSTSYDTHLVLLAEALAAAFSALRRGGIGIVCVENLRDDASRVVPFAFDVARIVVKHADLIDERIVCYPPRESGRNHEHAFIARAR